MYKALIFDCGEVIAILNNKEFLKEISQNFGIEESALRSAELEERIKADWGAITSEDLVANLNTRFGVSINPKDYYDLFFGKYVKLNTDLLEVIKELRKSYKILMLSNNNDAFIKYLEEKKVLKNFDLALFSCVEKMKKPDPAFFHKILVKDNLKREECLFVDDRIEWIEAGNKLGFVGLLYTSFDQFKKDLNSLGIKS